jgi:PhnB protein
MRALLASHAKTGSWARSGRIPWWRESCRNGKVYAARAARKKYNEAKESKKMTRTVKPVPEGYSTVTPVLTMEDTRKAIDWYKKALGAEEMGVSKGPDGKVMHADIRIGKSHIMLHDEMMGTKAPSRLGGSPVELWLYVDDCDALFERAVNAGAKVEVPVSDQFWGDRFGAFKDPFGLGWAVATHKEELTAEQIKARQEKHFAAREQEQLAGAASRSS